MNNEQKTQLKLTLLSTAFFVALIVLFGLGIGNFGLFDVSEARTAQISLEMMRTSVTGVALFNGQPIVGEFPLMHMAQVGAYHLFEVTPFAARVVSALIALLFVFVVYNSLMILTGKKRFALIAAAVVALNVPMVLFARIAVPDSLFWFLTLSSTFMMIGGVYDLNRNHVRIIIAGFLAGGAFLAGGLVGVVFPLVVSVLLALVREQPGYNLRQISPFTFLLAAGLALFPWAVGFVKTYDDPQSVLTYFMAMVDHSRHVGFELSLIHPKQILYVLLGLFPWALFLPAAIIRQVQVGPRNLSSNETRKALPSMALVWLILGLGVMLFIEVDYSTMFYSTLIPAAILVADFFDSLPEKPLKGWHMLYIVPLAIVGGILLLLFPQFIEAAQGKGGLVGVLPFFNEALPFKLPLDSASAAYSMLNQPVEWGVLPSLVGALVAVGVLVGLFIMRHGGREAALFVGGGALMALVIGVWGGLPRAYEYKQQPLHWVTQKIKKESDPKTDHVVVYAAKLPSVRFDLEGIISYINNAALVSRVPGRRIFVVTTKDHVESLEEYLPRGVKSECVGGYCLAEIVRLH